MAHSVPPRSSDVSCVIIKRLGASDAAPSAPIRLPARHRRPSARSSQAPPPATAPRITAPAQNTQNHPSTLPAVAIIHPQRKPSRCTQRTAEVQRRQLRHHSETRCQRRCPIWSDLIVCTPPPPLGPPLASPTTSYSVARSRLGPQHTSSSHSRRSQSSTHSASPADARSVQ
jgi:hypothetical protein